MRDGTTIARRCALYVFKREDGSTVEIQHSIHDEALTVCPETGQKMERVLQAFGSAQLPNRFYSEGIARKGTAVAGGQPNGFSRRAQRRVADVHLAERGVDADDAALGCDRRLRRAR